MKDIEKLFEQSKPIDQLDLIGLARALTFDNNQPTIKYNNAMKYKNYEIKRDDERNWKLTRTDAITAERRHSYPVDGQSGV